MYIVTTQLYISKSLTPSYLLNLGSFPSAVRVIDAKLKCVLEIMIPPSVNEEIKQAGKPLFDSIAIASHFIFIPSISQMQVRSQPALSHVQFAPSLQL